MHDIDGAGVDHLGDRLAVDRVQQPLPHILVQVGLAGVEGRALVARRFRRVEIEEFELLGLMRRAPNVGVGRVRLLLRRAVRKISFEQPFAHRHLPDASVRSA